MWRNWSLSVDTTLGHGSVLATQSSIPNCQLCPNNTYKFVKYVLFDADFRICMIAYCSGDSSDLCLPCNIRQATSSADRRSCKCFDAVTAGFIAHFNYSTGDCDILSLNEYGKRDQQYWNSDNAMTRLVVDILFRYCL
jgi:hypothetical protein